MKRLLLSVAAIWLVAVPASAQQVIATGEGERPGRKIEVTELKRAGDALMLRMRMVNEAEEKLDFGYDYSNGEGYDNATIGGIHLLDTKNKKKYMVMRDDKKTCVCSRGLKGIEPKQSANLWARFPAPPEGVDKITIVMPHFLPIDDVPITQ